jgi:hypothetical protein
METLAVIVFFAWLYYQITESSTDKDSSQDSMQPGSTRDADPSQPAMDLSRELDESVIARRGSDSAEAETELFRFRIAGVSHSNRDGSSRQVKLARLRSADDSARELELVHETDNPYDANAVAIIDRSIGQLGYVPRDLAARVARRLDRGEKLVGRLRSFVGGGYQHFLGVEISVLRRS